MNPQTTRFSSQRRVTAHLLVADTHEAMAASASPRSKIAVAVQGHKGSFAHQAAQAFFHTRMSEIDLLPQLPLKAIFENLINEQCAYGIIPLESSSHGTIHGVYDRLVASDGKVAIVGELGAIEAYSLCVQASRKGVSEVEIDQVICHPHIMDSCSDFLDRLDHSRTSAGRPLVERVVAQDSVSACFLVHSSTSDKIVASIGSQEAATVLGLHCLSQGVGNDQNAETRYVVLARCVSGKVVDPLNAAKLGAFSGDNTAQSAVRKASIALALRNIPGAIFKMSSCFAFRNIDIIKIESRPASVAMKVPTLPSEARAFTQRHWDLIFYIDYEPNADSSVNQAMINNLLEYCLWIRSLGDYRAGLRSAENSSSWNQMVDVIMA